MRFNRHGRLEHFARIPTKMRLVTKEVETSRNEDSHDFELIGKDFVKNLKSAFERYLIDRLVHTGYWSGKRPASVPEPLSEEEEKAVKQYFREKRK